VDMWLDEEMKNQSIILNALIQDKLIPAVVGHIFNQLNGKI